MAAGVPTELQETPVVALDRAHYALEGEPFAEIERIVGGDPFIGDAQPDGRRCYLFRGIEVSYLLIETPDRTIVRFIGLRPREAVKPSVRLSAMSKQVLDLLLLLKGLLR